MKWLRILGAILVLVGTINTVLGLVFDTAIIVALGIHAASFLTIAAGCAIGIGGVSLRQVLYRKLDKKSPRAIRPNFYKKRQRATKSKLLNMRRML